MRDAAAKSRYALRRLPVGVVYKVLIVDDDTANRYLLRLLLEDMGFVTNEAVNGREALTVFGKWKPDLIFMDLQMPEMNGMEAIRELRAMPEGATVPVIVITASAREGTEREVRALGANGFMLKPFRIETLCEYLPKVLPLAWEEEDPKPVATPAATPATRGNIMIVDDTPQNLTLLSALLKENGYHVRPLTSGASALRAAEAEPPDLILLDINMPLMDGFEVCRKLKEDHRLRDIPVIFISALDGTRDKVYALNAGGQDYITKPFQCEEVLARVNTHLKLHSLQKKLERHNTDLERRVSEQMREISDSQVATIVALAKLAESRDDDTGKHVERVQLFCRVLAERLGEMPKYAPTISKTFAENIFYAASLHDVGKVGITDNILLKPGKLSPAEFEVMKTHAVIGHQTLAVVRDKYPKNAFISMGRVIAKHHHEKWDGSGYPERLAGEAIPLEARIMAVADVYDALRSKRPYKEAFSHEKSRDIILESRGKHFAPDVVDAFMGVETRFDWLRSQMQD